MSGGAVSIARAGCACPLELGASLAFASASGSVPVLSPRSVAPSVALALSAGLDPTARASRAKRHNVTPSAAEHTGKRDLYDTVARVAFTTERAVRSSGRRD